MEIDIEPDKLERNMRKAAKDLLTEHKCACICIALKKPGAKKGAVRTYFGANGDTGRALLRTALNTENVDNRTDWTAAQVTAALSLMADNLVTYRSSKEGTAIVQKANWATHNCAESNLALYLYKQGKQLKDFTLASYQLEGTTCTYKPLCNNCVQWCRNSFQILDDYAAHSK
jgi:hypothetical protein